MKIAISRYSIAFRVHPQRSSTPTEESKKGSTYNILKPFMVSAYRLAVFINITISAAVSGVCARQNFARVSTRSRSGTTVVAFLPGRNASRSSRTPSWQQQQRQECSSMMMMNKLESPSAERNKDPIWQVLETKVFPRLLVSETGQQRTPQAQEQQPLQVLEIAAGAGVHMQYFTQQLWKNRPQLAFQWQSTDPDPQCLDSLTAYRNELLSVSLAADADSRAASDATNFALQEPLPLTLDANAICESSTNEKLQQKYFDLIVNINMIHISPWEATLGLFKLAGERQQPQLGILFLYGPYKVNGTCVESNRNFDLSLKARDARFGVRNLEDVMEVARRHGFELMEPPIAMPANNLSLIFRKT